MHTFDPNILAKSLDVVFCGTNPGTTAAKAGFNFSHSSNRFWSVLHLAGFTDVRLSPKQGRQLLNYGCGITAVVERPTRRADEVAAEEYKQSRPAFEAKMRRYAPRFLAFLGKRAFASMLDLRHVNWGRQSISVAGCVAWVLPNPSGLNAGFSLDALVKAYAELRKASY